MGNQSLVSIAVCTFNGEEFIEEQLNSLIDQTYSNLEIVVVDDGSTDQTVNIIRRYTSIYPTIRAFYNNVNLGYKRNFEKAVALSNGNFIALCDQDDYWQPDKIDVLMASIGDNLLIYHDSYAVIENQANPVRRFFDSYNYIFGRCNKNLLFENIISGHAMLFSAELKKYLVPAPNNFAYHDWWIAYIASTVGTITYFDKALVNFRQHGNNISDMLGRSEQAIAVSVNYQKKIERKNEFFYRHLSQMDDFLSYPFNELGDIQFLNRLRNLISRRTKGVFSLALFFFMLYHRKELFSHYKRNFWQHVNFIFRQSISITFKENFHLLKGHVFGRY